MNCKRLKASTIVETVAALTISVFIFGMVSAVFVQITIKDQSLQRIQIHETLIKMIASTETEKKFDDGELKMEGLTFRRQFLTVDGFPGVIHARFTVVNGHGILIDSANTLMRAANN